MKELHKFKWVVNLTSLVRSKEQIKQRNEKYKYFYQYKFDTDKHYYAVCYHDKKLKAEKKELEKKLKKEQKKPKEAQSLDVLKIIEKQLEHQNKQISESIHVMTKAKKHKVEVDQYIATIEELHKTNEKEWKKMEEVANQYQYLDPDKHKVLKIFASLCKNQEIAITGNGIVKDTLLRNKIINFAKNKMGGKKVQDQEGKEKKLIFLT